MFALLTPLLSCALLEADPPTAPPPSPVTRERRASVDTAAPLDAPSNAPAAGPSAPAAATGRGAPGARGGAIDCGDDALAEAPLVDSCVTATLQCGETLQGHTRGGADAWGGAFYRKNFCDPSPDLYSGPERVYRLTTPPNTLVDVTLESPCGELDLFMLSWPDADRCPTIENLISTCEADTSSGGGSVRATNIRHGYTYLVAVEGRGGEAAPFSLKVDCTPRR